MAKAVTLKVKLVSSADTGFYYVTKKNSRTMTEKMKKKKYDPIAQASTSNSASTRSSNRYADRERKKGASRGALSFS